MSSTENLTPSQLSYSLMEEHKATITVRFMIIMITISPSSCGVLALSSTYRWASLWESFCSAGVPFSSSTLSTQSVRLFTSFFLALSGYYRFRHQPVVHFLLSPNQGRSIYYVITNGGEGGLPKLLQYYIELGGSTRTPKSDYK